MLIYAFNTVTKFTTQLSKSLFLDGDWEEIQRFSIHTHGTTLDQEKIRPTLKLGAKDITLHLFGNSNWIL